MSWHFSQALEAAYLAGNCSDGERFAPWKSLPSVPDDLCSDKMKDICHRSPFGMMFVPSTDGPGTELLTWFQAAFPARTSASMDRAQDSTANVPASGGKCPGSFARYDHAASLWKTHQCLLLGDWEPYSETWPRWGLMQGGECWALISLDSITCGNESGLLATPLKSDGKGGSKAPFRRSDGRLSNEWKHYVNQHYGLTYPHPMHSEIRLGWPAGWTDCKPLATDKFRQWRQQHGKH